MVVQDTILDFGSFRKIMAMASAIIQLVAAIFKAFPSIREIIEVAVEASKSANVADALNRWKAKNEAVKTAIKSKKN